MDLTAITILVVGVLMMALFFALGRKVGKRDEGHRWHKACDTKAPIKFKNRLYQIKVADIDEFIDE